MPHYTDISVNGAPARKVCQYCGRPLKTCESLNQGCGDICRRKNRKSKYRVVDLPERRDRKREW